MNNKSWLALCLGACALVGGGEALVDLGRQEENHARCKAQLKTKDTECQAVVERMQRDGQTDSARIEDLSRHLAAMEAINFERLYDLDTNAGNECKWTMPKLSCYAVRLHTMTGALFHCTTEGCTFEACAEGPN